MGRGEPVKSMVEPVGATSGTDVDLDDPRYFLNKELTWLAFNRRVLAEAEREATPLLERVKFLSIFGSNLDEFFMKRMGGLRQQVGAGLTSRTVDGLTPREQIQACREVVLEQLQSRASITRSLIAALDHHDIRLRRLDELDPDDRASAREHFRAHLLPLVTPLAIDEAHPFPHVSNLSVNLMLRIREDDADETQHIRIKVPMSDRTGRFLRLGAAHCYVRIEEVVHDCLDMLLPGAKVLESGYFRVTRNAIVERDGEAADDLLEMIESELRERRFAPVVRLETNDGMPESLRDYLADHLSLASDDDVYVVPDMLAVADLMEIAGLSRPDLHDEPFEPVPHPRLGTAISVIEEVLRHGPLLVKHPYQSFDESVTRLLREAVHDPRVLAIKTTVYRTSSESEFVPLLLKAVRGGKQVAVVVELKARFDEAANIGWAKQLEEEGIHVSYGVVGYKTHAKAMLVVRLAEDDALQRIVHIGTGNYNSVTARIYSDIGLITADEAIGEDVTELFNLLTSGSLLGRVYRKLLVSPTHAKQGLLDRIEREIVRHESHGDGLMQLKTNAQTDSDITRALYRACQAGVQVDLLVRDSCRLRPGVDGVSESARVISLVGRFLEHTRLYYFRNGGAEEYFIGSADLMTRNLERRIEALVPIEAPALRAELREVLDLQLADEVGAWTMSRDGDYIAPAAPANARHSQEVLRERHLAVAQEVGLRASDEH